MAQSQPLRASEPESPSDMLSRDMLLLGTTGAGKSSTGNSILLKRNAFRVSNDPTFITSGIQTKWNDYTTKSGKRYRIKVIDGPGFPDTNLSKVQDRRQAVLNIGEALTECRSGIHAFLIVVRMHILFTEQDYDALQFLKRVLGPEFLKTHGLVVVAGGDSLNEDNPNLTFDEWCQSQTGYLKALFNDCNNRLVLFNNRTFSIFNKAQERKQVEDLLTMADRILEENQGKPYTTDLFRDFDKEYQKALKEFGYERCKEEFRTELSTLEKQILHIQNKTDVEQVIIAHETLLTHVRRECNETTKLETFRSDLVELGKLLNSLQRCDPGTPEFKPFLQDAQKYIAGVVERTATLTPFEKLSSFFNSTSRSSYW